MKPTAPLILLVALATGTAATATAADSAAPPAPAAAATVWRCGADGRDYRAEPCPDGRRLELAEPPGATQRAQAQAVAARERAFARQLVAERMAREAETLARGPGLIGITPVAARPAKAPADRVRPAPTRRPAAGGSAPSAARASRRTRD